MGTRPEVISKRDLYSAPRLFPEEPVHPHEQRNIAQDFVLLFHERLLTVSLAIHNVHPETEGRHNSKFRSIGNPRKGGNPIVFNLETA